MGRLTDDMTRLAGEINMGHADRARFVQNIKHATAEMRRSVANMRSTFMADIAGAHKAFFGAMTAPMFGRAKRGK